MRCVITDQLGNSVTSDSAVLSVLPQIVQLCIVDQPVSITATEGEEAVFSVTAGGGAKPCRYQWQRMTGIDQWTDIPGADQDTYRIESVQLEQNGLTVRCVIRSAWEQRYLRFCCAVRSAAATGEIAAGAVAPAGDLVHGCTGDSVLQKTPQMITPGGSPDALLHRNHPMPGGFFVWTDMVISDQNEP